jgi:hypothetical protein
MLALKKTRPLLDIKLKDKFKAPLYPMITDYCEYIPETKEEFTTRLNTLEPDISQVKEKCIYVFLFHGFREWFVKIGMTNASSMLSTRPLTDRLYENCKELNVRVQAKTFKFGEEPTGGEYLIYPLMAIKTGQSDVDYHNFLKSNNIKFVNYCKSGFLYDELALYSRCGTSKKKEIYEISKEFFENLFKCIKQDIYLKEIIVSEKFSEYF